MGTAAKTVYTRATGPEAKPTRSILSKYRDKEPKHGLAVSNRNKEHGPWYYGIMGRVGLHIQEVY